MKNEYIQNHNFGYGEKEKISKLHLRTIDDLKEYLNLALKSIINGQINNLCVEFLDKSKVELMIEEIN